MDAWALSYGSSVAFVCVSCAGPQLATQFGTELKLKNYSSGMMVRLAFAVMIEIDADVLLIDEVLSVGDQSFQRKSIDKIDSFRK